MTENQVSAVIGAAAALIGVAIGQVIEWLRDRGARSSVARTARADRLRELYVEVLTAAIQATPSAFGYRPSRGAPILSPESGDRFRARLEIEAEGDGQDVLRAFIGVVNFSTMYMGYLETNAQHPGHVERKELDATEQIIRKNMTALESACRKRLSELAK